MSPAPLPRWPALCALLGLLTACSPRVVKAPLDSQPTDSQGQDSQGQDSQGQDSQGQDSQGQDCTPLGAMFFDLGETLVVERSDGLFEPAEGAEELLGALRAQGLPIGVITNVPRGYDLDDLKALLSDPSILEYFDVVLLSSQASAGPKPDPDIFREAVAALASPPPIEQTAFVTEELEDLSDGDPPTEGAMAAGMIGVHVSDESPSPLVDYTVSPGELPSLATAEWVVCGGG